MAIVKNPSDGLNDTRVRRPTPVSAASRPPQSASAWARTDEGREAFARGFKVKVMDDKIDANGEPMSYLVSSHSPSREWLQAMKVELEKEPILDIPIRAGLRAEYHARIIQQLSQPKAKPGTPQYALDKADAKRQSRYDARLNEHFHDLEDICIEVRRLRGQHPSAPEELWAVALNRLVAAAASRWVEFLDQPFNGTPTLAMPRSFSPTPPRDRIGLPRTFKPRKGLYLKRKVEGFNTLTARQKRCLNPTKSVRRLVTEATFPVFAGEWKASRDDIEQAHGQAMYSIVQAAGIFCNAQSNQRILTLAAGFGWAWPTSGSWAGEKSDHDVCALFVSFKTTFAHPQWLIYRWQLYKARRWTWGR
ncbi:hypothetical protein B0H11DRAFT_482966 [Mycena galericulata]|nr:hypothetical protein B0H11DRAFT_482966 [Mycena galericulata]